MSSQLSKTSSPSPGLGSEVLIKVDNISKKFCRDFKKSLWYGLKDTSSDVFRPRAISSPNDLAVSLRPSEFWANKNISFEVKRGECLGLIGHNGAGKTTLLKMLNGLIKPDFGSIEMHGKVGALIALGAGFNPILTGRENVYVNGSILGLSKKKIDAKIDEIVEFAEVEDSIDAPVRTYSSGMQVRLGFAVAAVLVQPDVLLLDEVLAVGDMAFTIKCLNTVRQLTERSAVVFVSHNVQFVSQFCSHIMLLKDGGIETYTNDVSEGIEAYLSAGEQSIELSGSGEAEFKDESLWTATGGEIQAPRVIDTKETLVINLSVTISKAANNAQVMIILKDNSGRPVAAFTTESEKGTVLLLRAGEHHCKFEIGALGLTPGKYHFVVLAKSAETGSVYIRKEGILPFNVSNVDSSGYIWAPLSRIAKAEVATV
jgi:lipopolysaccharide transport system ATP-binding protein